MKKLKVAVLMGGKSPEHDISLMSGGEVVKNLDPNKYEVLPVTISKDGLTFRFKNKKYPFGQLSILRSKTYLVNCQLFFIAMHGPFGEDGTIQGFLELLGIPYTGSGVLASAIGMDKIYSMSIFTQAGLSVPKYVLFKKGIKPKNIGQKLKFPVFVKPANHGSSVGVTKVRVENDLDRAIQLASKYDENVIVQEFIDGTEVTAAVLGNEKPIALPLVEIVTKKEFFDYEAKYDANLTEEIVPARISSELTKKAQDVAIQVYKAIGCRGFGRVDMIIKEDKIYVLEINTIPGLTPVSLFPKAAKAAGISYPQLLDRIIDLSLKAHKQNP